MTADLNCHSREEGTSTEDASIILACGHVGGAFSYLLIDGTTVGCTISIQVL